MNRFERWSLWLATTATAVTGIGLFWAKYLIKSDDPWAVINHPLQPWLLKAHIVVVPALVFALGVIATRHIWPYAKAGLQSGLRSGIITALVTVPMIFTGYLIQVITEPDWLEVMAAVHIATGVLFIAGFAGHRLRVLLRAEKSESVQPVSGGARQTPAVVASTELPDDGAGGRG